MMYLNLASHPLKNRRLFFLLVIILGALFIFLLLLGGYTFINYAGKVRDLQSKTADVESKIQQYQQEEKELTARIQQAVAAHKKEVDRVNSLIYRKSFSWVEFLSDMEEVLPRSSYVVSLSPKVKEDAQIEVRFKVASPNLDELLKLNKRLYAMKFKDIRVISESRNSEGFLISEISVTYEKNT
jgi:Tfp pilus assembly protein PilN